MTAQTLNKIQQPIEQAYKPLTPFQLAFRRFKHHKLARVGVVIVAIFFFTGIFAPQISPYPYDKTSIQVFYAPGTLPGHILGTDDVGRDLLSRVIWGANTSLIVSISATTFCLIIGLVLGFLSGWYGGVIDYVVNRVIEIVGSMPGLLFQILIMTLLGNGIFNVTFALAILGWPGWVRLVRAQVLAYKNLEFMEASKALGASIPFIARRHMFPNILNPLLVFISFAVPGYIVGEAGLSFLGRGINDPVPSWGKMLADAGQYVSSYIYMGIIPTLIIIVIIIGFSFFGDGVRDALDPESERAAT
ncbi:MAG: ABC transporter permease [Chloroflexi bacterium]|nr:ABC transporter permease [Chloroflexota bacterium]